MNRKDIMRMAQEAGISTGFSVHIPKWDKPTWLFMWRFAARVAAAEREACAKECESQYIADGSHEDVASMKCAEAIRARGQA